MTKTIADADTESSSPVVISGTVDAVQFADRLKKLARYAAKSSVIPILQCAEITFGGFGVRARISHSGIDLKMWSHVDGGGTGSVFVPLRTLAAFMSSADGDTVTINKAESDTHVTFECGRFKLNTVPIVGDAPKVWEPDVYSRGIALGEGEMKRLLDIAAPFVSREETRYYLNGVAFEIGESTLRAVATDGHRLGTRMINTSAPVEAFPYVSIVHTTTIDAIRGLIGPDECVARFYAEYFEPEGKKPFWGHQRVSFSSKNWEIVANGIDGTYPDYRRVIPQSKPETVFIDIETKDIARISKSVKSWNARGARISWIDPETISISISSPDFGNITCGIKASFPDSFKAFGVNIHSLSGIAATIGGGKVEIAYIDPSDPHGPFIIRNRDDESAFAVLMPMRV